MDSDDARQLAAATGSSAATGNSVATENSAAIGGSTGAGQAVEQAQQVQVQLRRVVRFGRIVVGSAGVGVIAGAGASLFFPVAPGAVYTLGQVAGLAAVAGGVAGVAAGSVVSLILAAVARRRQGTAVAVQTEVSGLGAD